MCVLTKVTNTATNVLGDFKKEKYPKNNKNRLFIRPTLFRLALTAFQTKKNLVYR